MNRIIRPVGPVSGKLAAAGYRQYAVIIVEGEQLERTAILSFMDGDKLKYIGQHIDKAGQIHSTAKMANVKRAATAMMRVIDNLPAAPATKPAPAAKKAASKSASRRKPAPPRDRKPWADDSSNLIDCPGCGFLHRDDAMCV